MVVTASGFEQKLTDAPASISVIRQEDLRQKRFSNLAEALSDVKGVDIHQGTGKTGGLNISIRSMPSAYTLDRLRDDGHYRRDVYWAAPAAVRSILTSSASPPPSIT